MTSESCGSGKAQTAAYVVGVLGSFLIAGGLVWAMRYYTRPAPPDSARVEERRKASQEVNQTGKEQLETYGFVDPAKGQVRLPIQRAMELMVQDWKNPAAGRSNLLARVNQFNPPPPPPKPNPFE